MSTYRVFLGAPTAASILSERSLSSSSYKKTAYHWEHLSSTVPEGSGVSSKPIALLSEAQLESASQCISKLYDQSMFQKLDTIGLGPEASEYLENDSYEIHEGIVRHLTGSFDDDSDLSGSSIGFDSTQPSSLPPFDPENPMLPRRRLSSPIISTPAMSSYLTEAYSESASSGAFPNFQFVVHELVTISNLAAESKVKGPTRQVTVKKVSFLAAVLEVDGPKAVQIKKGRDAGEHVAVLELILGDDLGAIIKLTAWRECADEMNGVDEVNRPGLRKGDIVAFRNIQFIDRPSELPGFIAAPNHKSSHEVCYRTLPSAPADRRLMPDLRLGAGDSGVRRIEDLVMWISGSAGIRP